jgi:hypothetical protein
MLHIIDSPTDPLIKLIQDDPVRPDIPVDFRISNNNQIFVLLDGDSNHQAVVCVAYKDYIPADEDQLMHASELPTTAVFYTIWSYTPGSGKKLIRQAKKHIEENKTTITKFVTLSPRTEMARTFHLKNGASVFRENETSVNYEYH